MSENSTATKQAPKGLTGTLKYLFGVGDAGFTLMSNVETFFFMTFLTDIAAFSAIMAGVINSVFTTIDACLSWIYGGILNGTKAQRWGRYRSWLILTPWIVPFLYAFEFIRISENEFLSATIIIVAAVVSHIVWNIGWVANVSLISVVGKTPEEKATLSSSRAAWANIAGILFSYMGLPFATLLAGWIGQTYKAAATAFCLGILMVVGYFAHFKMTKGYEEIEDSNSSKQSKQKTSVNEMFVSLFQNPKLIILILADLAKNCVKFVTAASAIYYFRDAAGNPKLVTPYMLCIGISSVIGAYALRYFAKKFTSRTSIIIAFWGMAVFMIAIYFAYASSTTVIILMTIAMFFYGMAYAASPALYADTVTYATWKTGKDASGWIMGLQTVPLKIAIFLRGVIVSACLVSVGWAKGVKLDEAGRQSMTLAFGVIPGILCIAGALLIIIGFNLTKEKVLQYQAEINGRG